MAEKHKTWVGVTLLVISIGACIVPPAFGLLLLLIATVFCDSPSATPASCFHSGLEIFDVSVLLGLATIPNLIAVPKLIKRQRIEKSHVYRAFVAFSAVLFAMLALALYMFSKELIVPTLMSVPFYLAMSALSGAFWLMTSKRATHH